MKHLQALLNGMLLVIGCVLLFAACNAFGEDSNLSAVVKNETTEPLTFIEIQGNIEWSGSILVAPGDQAKVTRHRGFSDDFDVKVLWKEEEYVANSGLVDGSSAIVFSFFDDGGGLQSGVSYH